MVNGLREKLAVSSHSQKAVGCAVRSEMKTINCSSSETGDLWCARRSLRTRSKTTSKYFTTEAQSFTLLTAP